MPKCPHTFKDLRGPLGIAILALAIAISMGQEVQAANDPPTVQDLTLSGTQVYRGNSLDLEAFVTDDSDDQDDLEAEFQYLPPVSTMSITWSGSSRGRAYSVDISADGEYMVSGSRDGYISLWARTNPNPLWRYEVDSGDEVRSVAISDDGTYIVGGDENGTVYLFERDDEDPIWSNRTLEEVWSVDISDDGRYLVAGSEDGNVTFYDQNTDELWRYSVAGSSGSVTREIWDVDLSGDGKYVAVATHDRVYLLRSGTGGKVWDDYVGEEVLSVATSYDGRYTVAGSLDKKVYFWDKNNVGNGGEFQTTGDIVYSVHMSGSGAYFAAGSKDGKVYYFNQAGNLWNYNIGSTVQAVGLSNDSRFMLAGAFNGRSYLFEPGTSSSPFYDFDSGGSVQSVALTNDGWSFVDGGGGNKLNYHERWKDTYLGDAAWDTDHWETTFDPDTDTPKGDYNFRVRFTDSENGTSNWHYNDTDIAVRNNPPAATVDTFPDSPGYSTTTSFSFAGHGDDYEAATTAYQWVSDIQGTLSTATSFSLTTMDVGTHRISFRAQDNEGEWSPWVNNTLVIRQNHPPDSDDLGLSRDSVFHGQAVNILANASDDWELEANLLVDIIYKLPSGSFNQVNLTGTVTAVGLKGDGSLLVVGDSAGKVQAFVDNSISATWTDSTGSAITVIDVAQNASTFMVGTASGVVYYFDAGSSTPQWSSSQGSDILSISMSEDGGAAGVGTNNSKLLYYESWSSTPRWTKTLGGKVNSVSVTPGGDLVFCGSDDNHIWLYDLFGNEQWRMNTFADVNTVYASPDLFVSGNENGDIYLHDSTQNLSQWDNSTGNNIHQVHLSADGNTVYATDAAGDLYLWDWKKEEQQIPTGDPLRWKYDGEDPLTQMAATFRGNYFLVGSDNGTVHYFNNDSATPIWTYDAKAELFDLALDYFGETRALAAGSEGGIFFASWGTEYLGSETHVDDHWEIVFRPTTSAPEGNFTFRIKFDDPQGAYGNWTYYPNVTLQVLKGPPVAVIDSITEPAYDIFEVTFTGHGEDSSEAIIAYEWRSDVDGLLNTSASFSMTGLSVGSHNLTFRVQDEGNEWSFNATYQLWVIDYQTPTVLDLSLAASEVVRGGSVLLTSNATDDEKAENALTVEFESLFPGGGANDWDDSFLGTASYSGGQWRVTFSPPTDAPLDRFGFRVRFNDGLGWSTWEYRNQSLMVVNDVPTAIIEEVEPSPVEVGQTVHLNGTGTDNDGTIESYEWRSDLDGVLSDQPRYSTSSLSQGNHTLYFSVKDNDEAWSQEVTFALSVAKLPVANITSIDPLAVNEGEAVTFNGTGETDQGSIVAYEWSSDLEGVLSTQADFTSSSISAGNHTISFKVRNSEGYWSSVVTWSENLVINTQPVASIDSISPNPVVEGRTVNFRGSGTDNDGTIAAYQWRSNVSGPLSTEATFSNSEMSLGNHTIYLKVQDDRGAWSSEVSLVLDIRKRSANNQKPVAQINSTSPNPVEQGQPVTLRGWGTDSDGTIIAYEWSSDRQGTLGTTATVIRSDLETGQHNIYLRVQDDQGEWSTKVSTTLTVEVSASNSPPFATILDIGPNPALLDELVFFNGSGEDDDGTIVEYEWRSVQDNKVIGTTASFNFSTLSVGTHTISFKVKDNGGKWSDPHERSLEIRYPNRPPRVFVSSSPNKISQGEDKALEGTGVDDDPGDQVVSYEWISDMDGKFSVTPSASTASLSENTHQITFRARDKAGLWSDNWTFELVVGPPKEVPNGNGDDDEGGLDLPLIPILGAVVVIIIVGALIFAQQQGMLMGLGDKFGGGGGMVPPATMPGEQTPPDAEPDIAESPAESSETEETKGIIDGIPEPEAPEGDTPSLDENIFKPADETPAPPSAGEEPLFKAIPEAPAESSGSELPDLEPKGEGVEPPKEELFKPVAEEPSEIPEEPKETQLQEPAAQTSPESKTELPDLTKKETELATGTAAVTAAKGARERPKKKPGEGRSGGKPRSKPGPGKGKARPGERPAKGSRPKRPRPEGPEGKRRPRPARGDRPAKGAKPGSRPKRPRPEGPEGKRRPRPARGDRPAKGAKPGSRPKPRPEAAAPEVATIQCPSCSARMEIPKLGKLQNVKCHACGIEGEVEI